ncbi:unnamed protein product [Symbiodinium natans]|uniref:RRM domain-containing protein n=1 Tax=Symbiodinium natans TaxID=878477 RepID=A0A812UMA0_9DINO|nr:unnamed protein product [Symbiodinium natans]
MAPQGLDLSLEEVIKTSKGDGRGKGRKQEAAAKETKAEKEEEINLDMSLDELIEKEYVPAKGKGKGKREADSWQQERAPKGKAWEAANWSSEKPKNAGNSSWKDWKDATPQWKSGGGGGNWKEVDTWKEAETWKKNDWKKADAWKADWTSQSQSKWQDDWKAPKASQDWYGSNKSSWDGHSSGWQSQSTRVVEGRSWSDRHAEPAWTRPAKTETEREERWNAAPRGYGDVRDRRFAWRDERREHDYRDNGYDARDRREPERQWPRGRSRTPPRRYYDDIPRGNVIMVQNIPPGLDSRDIKDAFQSATGTVNSCNLRKDGTARISFDRPEDAKKAVATFDHGELNGSIISVRIEH